MKNQNEIKEIRLVLESIMAMSNQQHKDQLLNDFISYFLGYKIALDLKDFKNKSDKISMTIDEEKGQFDKIAELIESELERFGLKKEFGNHAVLEMIRNELEDIGITANSEEELKFINYLGKRWKV